MSRMPRNRHAAIVSTRDVLSAVAHYQILKSVCPRCSPNSANVSISLRRKESMSEIIFEVHEDEADGGYTASALGY